MSVAKELKKEDINNLLQNPVNEYLLKPPKERYAEFKGNDPFPLVPEALLNSFDIVRYVYTTGMIDPFYPESLEGAVYKCNFSGYYKYWDEKHIAHERTLGKSKSDVFKLPPNSISFLEIEPTFQIPTYLVLRFNLKVKHVYKGLLLGTGPIVDPGFVGKLYIPLHNLTLNEYVIKKDASLISVEFTKLSRHNDRNPTGKQIQIIKDLDFSAIPIINNQIEPSRDINFYLKNSLTDKMFGKLNKDELSVESSIPEAIMEAKIAEKSVINMRRVFYTVTGIVSIGTIIAIVALVINMFSLIDGVNARIDNISSKYYGLIQENKEMQEENRELKGLINDLQSVIDNMQQADKDKKMVSKSTE
jgi:deoxycytidine triphosphate deaminase